MANGEATFMEADEEPEVQLIESDITFSPSAFNVLTIISYIESGSIILPPYRRNYT